MTDAPETPETGEQAEGSTARTGPLAGRSVVVTRMRKQASALGDPLTALGAEVLFFPVLKTVDPEDWGPVDRAIADLESYDWIVLTSTNAVDRFLRRFEAMRGDPAVLLSRCFAAVGSATAEHMTRHGIAPALVPEDFRAEGLIEEFRALPHERCRRVLIPRALEAREILPGALREMGCEVEIVPVYRTVHAEPDMEVIERLRVGSIDGVTFTSGAIARGFVDALREAGLDPLEALARVTIASIGPVTTTALRAVGLEPAVEAEEATMAALARAVEDALARA